MTPPGSRSTSIRRRFLALVPVVGLLVLVPSCGDATPADGRADIGRTTSAAAPDTPLPGTATAPAAPAPGEQHTTATATPSGAGSPPSESSATRFAVVGDSITAGFAPVEGTTVRDRSSWIPFADQDERLRFAGGYAVPGATTAVMRDGVGPVDADVLVVMGGTNDVGTGVPWESTRANLVQIVSTAAVPVVVLSAIPPRDDAAEQVRQLNARLEALAAERGWHHVDPWAGMSDEGSWVAGTSDDGIHPVEQVVGLVGQRLAAALVASG
jgi:lysophospholipase L1-like esterase